ncbi:hypothetical protein [Marinobacter alexandrii]|jgi:hypothetical protein|uniref:hypothetical protein n=1 Tax=Marinobacter alexandrii TaxID=2570351 RepID=UPI002ABDC164|nr:hypothetical protein [Marinobacter alexandrii]
MKRFLAILVCLFAVLDAQAQGYDLPLDSLSEWTGEKSVRVVSNIDGLNADTEFLALLGRLKIKGFDVTFGGSESADDGLILEVLQVSDKIAVSIKSTDSQRYLLSVLIDEDYQREAEVREEVNFRGVLPLPADFNPKMVEALPVSDRENGELVFLSDSTLVLGVFDGNRIKRVDALTSNIKNSKAIFLSVGQSDSDPNPEIAVVWGQDRDISGKGQYTKIYSQLFEISGQKLHEETKKSENIALRFIDNRLHTQRYELLQGDIGKLAFASRKGSDVREDSIVLSNAKEMIFSIFPIDTTTSIVVNEESLELRGPSWESGSRLDLGKVSSPRLTKRLEDREITTSPDYTFSVNEEHLSIPRKVVINKGSVLTYLRKRRLGFSGLTPASGSDILIRARWDNGDPGSGFTVFPVYELSLFIIDFSYVKAKGESRLLILANEKDGNQGASQIYVY